MHMQDGGSSFQKTKTHEAAAQWSPPRNYGKMKEEQIQNRDRGVLCSGTIGSTSALKSRVKRCGVFIAVAFTSPPVTGLLLLSLSLSAIGAKCLWRESHPEHWFPYFLLLGGFCGVWLWYHGVQSLLQLQRNEQLEQRRRIVRSQAEAGAKRSLAARRSSERVERGQMLQQAQNNDRAPAKHSDSYGPSQVPCPFEQELSTIESSVPSMTNMSAPSLRKSPSATNKGTHHLGNKTLLKSTSPNALDHGVGVGHLGQQLSFDRDYKKDFK
ncbi:unnamed protein product [Amoebophrya sp. A120]|nr:unnamed protein product [Amoebophrya sp. A120]|eukprot:GSA120T00003201001.1